MESLSRSSGNNSNQPTINKSLTTFAVLLMTLLLANNFAASTSTSLMCPCTERLVPFAGCNQSKADYRPHYYRDIGLVGDCIPSVPENQMRCYKWRTAEACPVEGPFGHLRCYLTRRTGLEDETAITPDNVQDIAVMRSPGYRKKNYKNRSFCIYNISLSCLPGQTVELTTRNSFQSPLNDTNDYLWFSKTLTRSRLDYITGDRIDNFRDSINAHSFLAVLWSDRQKCHGRFELEARCSGEPTTPEFSSGEIINNDA